MPTIDLDKYRASIPAIKRFLDNKPTDKRQEYIGEAAVVTGCHIIAVCHYYGELYGYTPELIERLASLMKFYQMGAVTGNLTQKPD